ncbi:MAG: hypothetical protein H6737_25400 [Alphaproteobacteria bacterium]|nr:hypothetical protein [Alphaproteobacteria bacterium]
MAEEEVAPSARVWARDGLVAVLGANAGGVFGVATFVVARSGSRMIFDPVFYGLCAVALVAPLALGPLVGLALGWLSGRLRSAPFILMFAGSPLGALVGLFEFLVFRPFIGSSGDQKVFFLVGVVAGAVVGGLGWPIYMALNLAERPAWPALIVFPILASVIVLLPIGLALWTM